MKTISKLDRLLDKQTKLALETKHENIVLRDTIKILLSHVSEEARKTTEDFLSQFGITLEVK